MPGIGAEIMGAGKFGPPGWQDDADWKGWWGPNPPFHTPTFVLTHRPRSPIEMAGGTTFETRSYQLVWMRASVLGWLIQAAVGSLGGMGRRRNRPG